MICHPVCHGSVGLTHQISARVNPPHTFCYLFTEGMFFGHFLAECEKDDEYPGYQLRLHSGALFGP